MCKCLNIDMGSYARQTSMRTPDGKWIGVDTCLVQEIAELWYLGIETIECCCGHNKTTGYIAVPAEYHQKMIDLGYEPENGQYGLRPGFFYPLIRQGSSKE